MAIEVNAQKRQLQGTGASRRLRRAGRVPGIVYGGSISPVNIELDHNALFHQLRQEKFHASILTLSLDGAVEQVLLRAVNMHPWKQQVDHVDFQRVLANEKIHMKVPLHFKNAEISPAVKVGGAIVSHVMNEVDIRCLPADLPEFVEVDLSELTAGHSVHVLDLKFPNGVEPVLHRGENPAVATAQVPRVTAIEEEEAAAAAAPATPASAVPAAKQPDKPEAAKADGGKGEAPKGGGKK
jgi:large subunit ribosomal protein L25